MAVTDTPSASDSTVILTALIAAVPMTLASVAAFVRAGRAEQKAGEAADQVQPTKNGYEVTPRFAELVEAQGYTLDALATGQREISRSLDAHGRELKDVKDTARVTQGQVMDVAEKFSEHLDEAAPMAIFVKDLMARDAAARSGELERRQEES